MSVNEIIRDFQNSPEAEKRRSAAQSLAAKGIFDSEVTDAFVQGLFDSDLGVKDICAAALINYPSAYKPIAAEKLSPLITNPNIEIRNLGGDILIKLGVHSVEPLLPYLYYDDPDVKKFSCDILGVITSPIAVEKIKPLLNDDDPNVQIAAIEALGNIGDLNSLLHLTEKYDSDDGLKPSIIDALGKIGGTEAENFLLALMQSEQDTFLKLAAIDALAVAGSEPSICNKLMGEIENYPEEIRVVILKTIFAVANRLEINFKLPDDLRHIAHRCLMDDDPDICAAGIIALGDYYRFDDVEPLVSEVLKGNLEIQSHILSILMANSDSSVVERFLRVYCANSNPDGSDIEFLSLLIELQEYFSEENIQSAVRTLSHLIFASPLGNSLEIAEIIMAIEPAVLKESILYYMKNGDEEQIDEALELAIRYPDPEYLSGLENLIQTKTELSEKAKYLWKFFNE